MKPPASCPVMQSSRTHSPHWTLEDTQPFRCAHKYSPAPSNPRTHAYHPTHAAHRLPRTRMKHTLSSPTRPSPLPPRPQQLPFPPIWKCPQLPFRLKLFQKGPQGPHREGGSAWRTWIEALRTWGSWLTVPLPLAPHLVNRGTARGYSRSRARSPSRRGTRTASCWLRGGRACAP